ncbi:MAG: hypothetical protein QM537_03340 [Candidatus Symbiobacter sp.]|nr:hypothetical protein [Candidatus Symbiobacter sp.]
MRRKIIIIAAILAAFGVGVGAGIMGYRGYHKIALPENIGAESSPQDEDQTADNSSPSNAECKDQALKEWTSQESINMAGVEKQVKRINNRLELNASSGKKIIFTDGVCKGGEGTDCNRFSFYKHFNNVHAFIVYERLYEGMIYYWVDDRTGEVTKLEDNPQLSPSGKKFALVNGSESDEYFSGIEIWSLESGKPVKEWTNPQYAFYSFVMWENDDTIVVTRDESGNDNGEFFSTIKPVEILRLLRRPEWHLEKIPSP